MKKPKPWTNRRLFVFGAPGVVCFEEEGSKYLDVSTVMADGAADAKHVRKLAERLLAAASWLEAK